MDHAEALALIEEAALEPGGLDRLMAGDTPSAAALAGHVAGCGECTRALAATRRTIELLRLAAADAPSSDLRERTLARVAALGRPRGAAAGEPSAVEPATVATGGMPTPVAIAAAGPRTRSLRGRAFALLAAAAAFALLAAGSFLAADLQGELERTRAEAAHLRDLYTEIEALLQQPGARLVALRGAEGTMAGALVVDGTGGRVAVLTDDLPAPPAGQEYRCWVELAGQREPVGRMWFEDGLAYWAGEAPAAGGWPSGASFGVSLEAVDQPASEPAILSGDL